MQDKIFRVVVPEEEETEIKDGKKKVVKKKVFPGYVLVEIIMTDDSWYVVRNTPGVTGFVGSSGSGQNQHLYCLKKLKSFLKRMGMEEQRIEVDFELGETVTVKEGPFANFTGISKKLDQDKGKVKVHVNMFGRETPVELDFTQVEKI